MFFDTMRGLEAELGEALRGRAPCRCRRSRSRRCRMLPCSSRSAVRQLRDVLGGDDLRQALGEHRDAVGAAAARRLTIAPTSVSTIVERRTLLPRNSSGMSVSVAPAALPMPSARWPAFRPMATTKYQRPVVLASTIRLWTISTPTCARRLVAEGPDVGRQVEIVVDRLRHVHDAQRSPSDACASL